MTLVIAPAESADHDEKFNLAEFRRGIESKIQKRTLANGLRVIAMRQPSSPTVACYLKIGVGSSDEPFDQSGTAHFLEHLLFKGTKQMGTTDFAAEKIYLDQIEADGERIPLKPMTSVMIKPGCVHRAVGNLKIINVPMPPFDPADEFEV